MTETTGSLAEQGATPPVTLDAIAASLVSEAEPTKKLTPATTKAEPPPPDPGTAESEPEPEPTPEAAAEAQADGAEPVSDVGEEQEIEVADPAPEASAAEVEPDILSVFDQPAEAQSTLSPEADVFYDVPVDGEVRQVKASELIRSFSTEGAIDARMQEASEARNKALAEAQPIVDDSRALQQRLSRILQEQNSLMFAPKVSRPDPQLQEADPIGFVGQMEAYRQDQERIATDRGHMTEIVEHAEKAFQENKRQVLAREAESIKEKLPSLKKPEMAAVFRAEIATIGAAHGFSVEEIAGLQDHRILTLAAEAAAYRKLKAQMAPKPAANGKRPAVRPAAQPVRQPMRAGGKGQQTPGTRKAASRRKAMSKAQQTGSVDDIALTLLI